MIKKIFSAMFLLAFLLSGNTTVSADEMIVFVQDSNVSVSVNNKTIKEVLNMIEKEGTYRFLYDANLAELNNIISINVKKEKIEKVLGKVLANTNLVMQSMDNNLIVITTKEIALATNDEKKSSGETLNGRANSDLNPGFDSSSGNSAGMPGGRSPSQEVLTVKGKVIDANTREPVAFVTIYVKENKNKGTFTDGKGNYTLTDVVRGHTLVYNFLGYRVEEVKIEGQGVINVELVPETTTLEDVMVVAYGTVKKASYSGSATQIKQETFKDIPVVSFEQALAGVIPGVQVSQMSGQPGSLPEIRIRGFGSFNAGNEPLYVIDGVPATSGDWGSENIYTSSMNYLNPGDIESITILKDAAAASLYGSRASNGVVLITTKKGKIGRPVSTFKADVGVSYFAVNNYPLASEEDTEMLVRESWRNYGNDNPVKWASYGSLDAYVDAMAEKYYPSRKSEFIYVDWEDQLFRTGVSQNYEYNISGGSENSKIFASVAYNNEKGVNVIEYLKRITASVNAETKITNRLSVGGSFQYSKQNQSGHQDGEAKDNPFYLWKVHLTNRWPFKYASDGTYWMESYNGGSQRNPVSQFDLQINDANQLRILLKGWAELKLTNDLKVRSIISSDYLNVHDRFGWLYGHVNFSAYGDGYMSDRYRFVTKLVSSTVANYSKSLGDHNISAMIGWEGEKEHFLYTRVGMVDFANYGATQSALATTLDEAYTYTRDSNLLSAISSVNYDYKSRYYISGSYRRDGSSRLSPEKRWGGFWSVSGSWRLSNEKFLENVNWVNELRLRGSYGTSGTLPSDHFGYMAVFDYDVYGTVGAGYPANLANSDLTWEKNKNWNVAVDLRLFDKVDFVAEYYNKLTTDLLLDASVPSTTGFYSALTNIGSMVNKGVELGVNVEIIKKKDLSLSLGFNWSTLHNEVLALSEEGEQIVSRPHIWKAGYSYTQYYTREYYGADPATGQPLYYSNQILPDGTRDRTLVSRSQASSTILEGMTAIPKGFGGFNAVFSWKSLTASMAWSYKYGHYIWDDAFDDLETDGYNSYKNIAASQVDRWQKAGDEAYIPRRIAGNTGGGYYDSSRALKKGDYLRLKNLSVSYSLPKNLKDFLRISNARIYISGTNLLTFTGLNFDPEVQSNGYYNFTLPALRTLTIGLEVSL
jgi:TonB-linked SusC/RagA family outer membrane protein